MALIETEDGRIVEAALEVEKGYMVDNKTHEAWGLFPNSLVRKRGTKTLYALLNERDAAPMIFEGNQIKQKEMDNLISDIAKEARKAEQYEVQLNQNKERMAEILKITIIALVATLVLIILLQFIFSGRLDLPF